MAGLGELVAGGRKEAPPPPTPQPVVRMPDESDPAVLEARKKRREAATGKGRESTILSGDSGGTGGSSYTGTVLGR